jgi:hypothetical protein
VPANKIRMVSHATSSAGSVECSLTVSNLGVCFLVFSGIFTFRENECMHTLTLFEHQYQREYWLLDPFLFKATSQSTKKAWLYTTKGESNGKLTACVLKAWVRESQFTKALSSIVLQGELVKATGTVVDQQWWSPYWSPILTSFPAFN